MSSRETAAMYIYGLAFVLLMSNLPCVGVTFKQGTCNWICKAHTDMDEETRNILATGSLVKFSVSYEEQVRRECRKQTVAKNSRARASLWLKMAAGGKQRKNLQGRLQLVTQTILDGIFGGQFAFGTYKEMNVSCVLRSTSIGISGSNNEPGRLTFHNSSSGLYFVELVGNYSNPSTTFGKSGSNYSPVRLTFNNLSSVLYYVEQVANYSKPSTIFLTLLRTEKNTFLSLGVTSTSGSLSSAQDNELIVTHGWLAVAIIICILVLLYSPATFILFRPSEIVLGEVPRKTRKVQEELRAADEADEHTDSAPVRRSHSPIPLQETSENYDGYIEPDIREGHVPPTEHDDMIPSQSDINSIASQGGSELKECSGRDRESATQYGRCTSQYNISFEKPSEADRPLVNDAELANASHSDRNIEKQSVANSPNETVVDTYQSREEEDEAEIQKPGRNPSHAMIVGETYPVGFGSYIGNKLFSTTHERNITWSIVKFIFMFSALPLLPFLGLGDFFLVVLPKLHSRLSDHLPFAFLTRSLGYSIIDNHPYLLVPIMVISAFAYLISLFFLCFFSRNTLEKKWQSCFVHRMHPTWLACKLLQYFISELPSSLKPFKNCSPAPPECFKYLDLPENILHNLEKQPDIFIKCWECCSHFWKLRKSSCSLKGILFSLVTVVVLIIIIIIFIIIGIFCTSPLACLVHGRLRWRSRVLQSVFIFFSLVWVVVLSLICAIPLGVVIIGLIKVRGSINEMLPQVTIAGVCLYYLWSCYSSFRTPYHHVANCLAWRYQKKYDEQENGSAVNSLIHYKHNSKRIIPRELFDDGCKEFKLSIKNNVALLLFKLVCTLLVFCFFFPIPDSRSSTTAMISFFAVAFGPIFIAVTQAKFQISDVEAGKVVDDFIARKQQDSS